jgi:hypothetical protein
MIYCYGATKLRKEIQKKGNYQIRTVEVTYNFILKTKSEKHSYGTGIDLCLSNLEQEKKICLLFEFLLFIYLLVYYCTGGTL